MLHEWKESGCASVPWSLSSRSRCFSACANQLYVLVAATIQHDILGALWYDCWRYSNDKPHQIQSRFPFDYAMPIRCTLRVAAALTPLRVKDIPPQCQSYFVVTRVTLPLTTTHTLDDNCQWRNCIPNVTNFSFAGLLAWY